MRQKRGYYHMIEDLFNAMSSGEESQPDSQAGQTQGNPLADLLGGLLGGSATSGSGDLASMLGGSGGAQQGDSMAALASMLGGSQQGGGAAGMGGNDLLAPIVSGISEKLGLPPDIVRMIVSFVIGKLLSGQSGAGAAQTGGLDLSSLLNQMASGQGVDANYLKSTGMHEELAQQTGLDPDTATRGLQEVFNLLGGQLGQR